jgi:hypothetical protein
MTDIECGICNLIMQPQVKCNRCVYQWCVDCHYHLDKCPYCRITFQPPRTQTLQQINQLIIERLETRSRNLCKIMVIMSLLILSFEVYMIVDICYKILS